MRRAYRLAAAIGFGVGGAAAGPQPPTPPPQPPAAAAATQPGPWANKFFLRDVLDRPEQAPPPAITHDFGDVPHGTLCTHTFTVTNPYDAPMQVVKVRGSCTCLGVQEFTRVLGPFESAPFTVTMNTAKFVGADTKTLYVEFGPKYASTAILKLSANSRTEVQVNPGAVAFGSVARGARVSQAVRVEFKGDKRGWKLTEAVPPAGPLEVEFREVGRGGPLRGGAEYLVTVSLKPTAPPGPISGQITLKTNDPANPLVQLAVTGQVLAPLVVDPERVRLTAAAGGPPATASVLVRAASTKPFKITGVVGDGNGLAVDLPLVKEPLPSHRVTVRFTPKAAGTTVREVRLKTDLEGGAVAVVPVEVEVK